MMETLERVALVTGASGNGIGRSVALTLARKGTAVAVNYLHSQSSGEAVAKYINENGGCAFPVQGDVFDPLDCRRMVETVLERLGRVDICVIGPGANWNPEPLEEIDPERAFQDALQELRPIYNLLPLVLKDMQKQKTGRVVGISSNLTIPSPAYCYNAAKASRTGALLQAVNEAWKLGVTVNVVAPGPVDPFSSLEEAWAFSAHGEYWRNRTRVTPQDVADCVAFLCSEEARYLTGCVLPLLF